MGTLFWTGCQRGEADTKSNELFYSGTCGFKHGELFRTNRCAGGFINHRANPEIMRLLMLPSLEMPVEVMKLVTNRESQGTNEACDEVEVYDAILSAFQQLEVTAGDRETEGSRLIVLLSKAAQSKCGGFANVARNGLLIVLALFFPHDAEAGVHGRDFKTLEPLERAWVLGELAAAFAPR